MRCLACRTHTNASHCRSIFNGMKQIYKDPLAVINTALIIFLAVLVLNANAERLRLPQSVKQALAAVASITGSGTSNRLAAFAAANQIGDSIIQDDGTNVGVGMAPGVAKLSVNGAITSGTISDGAGTHGLLGAYNSGTAEAAFGVGTSATDGAQWRLIVVPTDSAGGFNGLAQNGDVGLIYKGSGTGPNPTNGLVIGPWYDNAGKGMGIRVSKDNIAINAGVSGGSLADNSIGIASANRIDLSAPIVSVNGTFSKPAGSFLIDHPLDPKNKYLKHSFVESPEMRNVYYGQAATRGGGTTIILPEWWVALNGSDAAEYNYQLTPMGRWCQLFVKDEIRDNRFTVASANGDCAFSWTVSGVRHDAYAERHRIEVEGEKGVGNSLEAHTYLHPELFDDGK